ncbi:tyrosine-type recombinase/integrase [Singulisphaera sp. GP187]|uniref:tyrosine-type recombinase/integrase n=1 Tax=Singulisphaera sp. GP187 TaxID=1882752 RepID=UPI0020B118D9|nr:tyrosine-type recombinase/integrase [Singulisphaera sp. GP187]
MLLDWMVTGQIIPVNPAASVSGLKHVVSKGLTPYLSAEDTRTLLTSIEPSTLLGLRDRALIAVMTYSFARISATLSLTVDDYYANGKKWRLRLHKKGGRRLEVLVHHKAEEHLDAYIQSARIEGDKRGPLFRAGNRRSGELKATSLRRNDAWGMVKRRVAEVGLTHKLCNHSFRATGVTALMASGGNIEKARKIAGHASTKTTQLYDRTDDEITLAEIERTTTQMDTWYADGFFNT